MPSSSSAARHASKKVAANVPRFSLAFIESWVSPGKPCFLRRVARGIRPGIGAHKQFPFSTGANLLLPEGAALAGEIVVDYMREHNIDCLGGLELGATTVAAVTATMSHFKGWPVHAFFVRKDAKSHGAKQKIDGHLRAEAEVLAVDDVATTGNSILDAIKDLNGAIVRCALVVLDREEDAAEKLATHGIELASIFKKSDFSL
jgi:orotate phosphoribosyltransferase